MEERGVKCEAESRRLNQHIPSLSPWWKAFCSESRENSKDEATKCLFVDCSIPKSQIIKMKMYHSKIWF